MENKSFTFTTVSAFQMVLFGSIALLLTLLLGIFLGAALIPNSLQSKLEKFEFIGYLLLCIPGFFAMFYGFSFAAYTTTINLNDKGITYSKKRQKIPAFGQPREVLIPWSAIQSYSINDEANGSVIKLTDKNNHTHTFTFSSVLEDAENYNLFSSTLNRQIDLYNEHRANQTAGQAQPTIVKGKNFYGSKGGKIYGIFILLFLVGFPILVWQFKLPITTISILKIVWIYPLGFYMMYRIFIKRE